MDDVFNSEFSLNSPKLRDFEADNKIALDAPITNPFKKPFMPTSWKWFRTSGQAKVYNFVAKRGEINTLEMKIPSQFAPYLRNAQGEVFPGNGSLKIKMEGDTNDYLTMGGRQTVTMYNGEDFSKTSPTRVTFPTLKFKTDGVEYSIDWNSFAQDRRLANGAFDEDWGYSYSGSPVLGQASMYDKTVTLKWDRKFKWWWLLIFAGLGYGIHKFLGKGKV
jgi:hypothetical protein